MPTVETPENGPLGQRMGHLFPSKLACHTLPFWQHLQAAQAGGPFFVQITWATISLYFKDDPGLQIIWPWLSIFSEYKSTLKIFGRFFSKQEAFLNFNAKIRYYWRIVNSWVLTVHKFGGPLTPNFWPPNDPFGSYEHPCMVKSSVQIYFHSTVFFSIRPFCLSSE